MGYKTREKLQGLQTLEELFFCAYLTKLRPFLKREPFAGFAYEKVWQPSVYQLSSSA